jgi:hypothetical protein
MSTEWTRKDYDDLSHRTLTDRRPRQRCFVDVGMAGVRLHAAEMAHCSQYVTSVMIQEKCNLQS